MRGFRFARKARVIGHAYVIGYAFFLTQFFAFTKLNTDWQAISTILQLASFAVTWICLFNILRLTDGIVGALISLVVFFVPVFGSLIFFSGLVRANLFLRHNGYERTFVGGKPDLKDRQQMALDEYYIPSAHFDYQGNRRSRFDLTLASSFLVLLFFFWVAVWLA